MSTIFLDYFSSPYFYFCCAVNSEPWRYGHAVRGSQSQLRRSCSTLFELNQYHAPTTPVSTSRSTLFALAHFSIMFRPYNEYKIQFCSAHGDQPAPARTYKRITGNRYYLARLVTTCTGPCDTFLSRVYTVCYIDRGPRQSTS